MRNMALMLLVGAALAGATIAVAGQVRGIDERQVRRVLRQAFPSIPQDWQARLEPDQTMATCAAWRNQPSKGVGEHIRVNEKARIRYPADGNVMGDWRRGEKLAQSGYGLRFTDTDAGRANGGNCYACHKLSPDEDSYGTIGTSLEGYGRIHKFRPEDARTVYEKIYNSQSVVPCSLMPRFGTNGILSIEQIKDIVALLMDPESPVNRPPREATPQSVPADPRR
jgi:sulfur-oxidizing protein SoxX